jgi:hypothetical protein
MKLQLDKLTNVAFGTKEDGSADLKTINAQIGERMVVFTRRMAGWQVHFVIKMDDRIIHDEVAAEEDKVAWTALATMANDSLDSIERVKANQRYEACKLLFGRK